MASHQSTIPERFAALLLIWVDGKANAKEDRFEWLADRSNVKAASWRSVWHRKQKPTTDMLEAICKSPPEFAFWLMTGVEDSRFGHRAPVTNGYPELTRELIASSNYLQNELLVSTQADLFIEETYPDLEFEAKNEIEKLALYDKLKRYVSFSEYEIDNRKQMRLSANEKELREHNFRLRFLEILIENAMSLTNPSLTLAIADLVIFSLHEITQSSPVKFELLEKALNLKSLLISMGVVTNPIAKSYPP